MNLAQSVAPPALLCHKETAHGTQSLGIGHFLHYVSSLWHKAGVRHTMIKPILDPSRAYQPGWTGLTSPVD